MPPPEGDVGPNGSTPLADAARLAALERSALLDSDAEEAFERLTRIATSMLGAPVSLVSLVAADRQFFKSASGLPEPWASRRGSPLSHSFCQHVVTRAAPLVVGDARQDPLLRTNAAIDDLGVVAYAGYPIRSSEGEVIGSLCAIDHVPRLWTPRELALLEDLASLAHTELVLRASARTAQAIARDAERMFAERQAVIESTSDGIYTTDLTGRCTFANAAVTRLLGYPTGSLIGQDMHARLHHHDGDGSLLSREDCALAVALERGLPARMNDTVFMRHDGSALPVEVTFSPLFQDGALDGAVVTFRDISERVAAAAVLHESESKFRAVFEDAGIGIVISALDGRLLDCNAAYVLLTGYTREELVATSFEIVTDPADAVEQRRLADELLAGRQAQLRMEKQYVRKDGAIVWGRLTATLMRDAAGAPRFLVGAVEDITLQRRAAQAMRLLADAGAMLAGSLEYETRLEEVARRALPTLGDACVLHLTASGAARQSLRVHRDPTMEAALRAIGEIPLPSGDAEHEDERRSRLLDVRALAEASAGPWANLAALGLITMIVLPIRGRTGTLGWLGFLSAQPRYADEDVRLAEELAARAAAAIDNAMLYRSAQSATRIRDEVLAVVSHDLRNPVHTITMGASVLLELPALDQETIRQQLGVIRRSALRATQLISDLLDVTRIENGQLRLDRELVPVRELLADAAQLVASRADERRITVSVAAAPDTALADVDRHRVLQALDNLLGNALKFTPTGGAVALSARADERGAQFTVHDSGPGIPADERPHLFQRFWQAHRGDRRGVGLGLSIVKGIVDAHGGVIEVGAEESAGTSIRFTIPRRGLDTEAVA